MGKKTQHVYPVKDSFGSLPPPKKKPYRVQRKNARGGGRPLAIIEKEAVPLFGVDTFVFVVWPYVYSNI